MISSIAAAVVAAAVLTGAPAGAVPGPPPGKIGIEVVNANGSGCQRGTTAVAVSPDNTSFTVTYSDYLAQVGVGAKPADRRKSCQLSVVVHVPRGYTYGIYRSDYRGFAHLEAGASAVERAKYHFQGMAASKFVEHPVRGPLSDNWQHTDVIDIGQVVHKPCGTQRNFNIHTELQVDAGTSDPATTTSFIAMDSTDGDIKTTYHFAWKTCPA